MSAMTQVNEGNNVVLDLTLGSLRTDSHIMIPFW
jgi:hypothetical protein